MDDDHAQLELLLDRVVEAKDEALPELLAEIEAEIRAHFGREEELMRARQTPILSCHVVQHEMFLSQFSHGQEAARSRDAARLRHFLGAVLPALLADHVNTVDRVTAGFLRTSDGAGGFAPPAQTDEPET
jgi:hemerythrin-like metal-binding protein